MNPVPVPDPVEILTTAGIALATALMTADDSSMRTCDTFVPRGVCEPWAVASSSRRRLETAAAERDPDTMPAATATATIAPEPRPRRSPETGAALAIGGRVDQAGTALRSGGLAGCDGGGPNRRTSIGSVGSLCCEGSFSLMTRFARWFGGREARHAALARLRPAGCGREVS